MTEYYHKKREYPDWLMLVCYLVLVLFGWMNIYSSTIEPEHLSMFDITQKYGMQIIWIGISIIVGIVVLYFIDSSVYEPLAPLLYFLVFLLLVAVIFMGKEVNGSNSWFEIGPVKFQPAEISKISTSLLLAYIMSKFNFSLHSLGGSLVVAAIIMVPMLAIIMEKETGSALVYLGFTFMLYREGLSGWFITFGGEIILMFILTIVTSPLTALICTLGLHLLVLLLVSRSIFPALAASILLCIALLFTNDFCQMANEAFLNVPDALTYENGVTSIASTSSASVSATSSVASAANGLGISAEGNDTAHEEKLLELISPALASVILAIPFIIWLYVSCIRRKLLYIRYLTISLVATSVLIFSADFVFNSVLQPHQKARIENLLGITEDLHGVGYNVFQSKIAIGSGGWVGKGFLNGTQTKYNFVPEQSTDFIFCTVGEEWGFFGSVALLMVYLTLIVRIVVLAEKQKKKFSRIYGYCIACCFFMHVFINMGMTMGILPVIGIPLPFMSYGGSSLLAFTVMLAIFMRLDMEDNK